jgi:ATP-dependent Lon protease
LSGHLWIGVFPGASPCPLLLVGPPGVGKTFVAYALAAALGRPLARIDLEGSGGARLVLGAPPGVPGAAPGAAIRAACELDGEGLLLVEGVDYADDDALDALDALADPERRRAFRDRFLDLPWDLSPLPVLIAARGTTALVKPLRERVELIELPGYSRAEQLRIANEWLLPQALRAHGLEGQPVDAAVLRVLVERYADEPGLHSLERAIARLCRTLLLAGARADRAGRELRADDLLELLGEPIRRFHWPDGRPGAATFLSARDGGAAHVVEVALTHSPGEPVIVGDRRPLAQSLVELNLAWLRTAAFELGLDESALERARFQLSLPVADSGAGAALAAATVSALSGWPLHPRAALAAAIGLRGELLPVERLAARLLAAERAGTRLLLLAEAQRDEAIQLAVGLDAELQLAFAQQLPKLISLALQPPAAS